MVWWTKSNLLRLFPKNCKDQWDCEVSNYYSNKIYSSPLKYHTLLERVFRKMFWSLLGDTVTKTVNQPNKFDWVHQTVSPCERVWSGDQTTDLEGDLCSLGVVQKWGSVLHRYLVMSRAWEENFFKSASVKRFRLYFDHLSCNPFVRMTCKVQKVLTIWTECSWDAPLVYLFQKAYKSGEVCCFFDLTHLPWVPWLHGLW